MSSKASLVLFFIIGLLLAAMIARNGSLALMTLPFLFYLAAGFLTSPEEVQLRVSRRISKVRCEAKESITHTLVVENQGKYIPHLKVCEQVLPKVKLLEGNFERRVTLAPGEKVELSYTFFAPRGQYEWKSTGFVASDLFGLFERRCQLATPAQLLVLPEQIPVRKLSVRLTQTLRTVGPNLSRLPGSGIDFWGVREYHSGDSLRWIHWRNTARHPQQLFTKEFEREEMGNIGLLLDARLDTNMSRGEENLLEHSIQATASLAKSLLQMGNRVSLLIIGERIVRVFPGTGKHQLVRIFDRLAECEPGKTITFDTLKYLPVRLFPAKSMIILVSPLRSDDFSSVARLRAEGYQVLLVSPDPIKFSLEKGQATSAERMAARIARVERKALLWRIRRTGVGIIDWAVDQPLTKVPRINFGGRL